MSQESQFKKALKDLLSNSNLETSIKFFRSNEAFMDHFLNEIILIESRLFRLNRDRFKGKLTNQEYQSECNKITSDLIDVIDSLNVKNIPSSLLNEVLSLSNNANPIFLQNKFLSIIPEFSPDEILERDEILRQIHHNINSSNRPVILSGILGIGKSTLARSYLFHPEYQNDFVKIAWVNNTGNLYENFVFTFKRQLNEIGVIFDATYDAKENAKQLIFKLNSLLPTNLLVFDNVNQIDQLYLLMELIEGLNWKVLITSRTKPSDFPVVIVKELSPTQAKNLFYFHFSREKDDSNLNKILQHINYHTLLTELIAKACENNKLLNLSMVVELLNKEGIKSKRLQSNVFTGSHGKSYGHFDDAKLFSYITSAIFDQAELSILEKQYLRYFSLLPSKDIRLESLITLFQIDEVNEVEFFDTIRRLEQQGWVQSSSDTYRMHHLVQTLIQEKLNPTFQNCEKLILSLVEILKTEERINFLPFIEQILGVINPSNEVIGFLMFACSELLFILGSYQNALTWALKAKEVYQELSKDRDQRCKIDVLVSLCYRNLNDIDLALKYGLSVSKFLESKTTPTSISLANAYGNLATCYLLRDEEKDIDRSFEYGRKALEIHELYEDDPNLKGHSYNMISVILQRQKKYEKALYYGWKAYKAYATDLSKINIDLPLSLINIAINYQYLDMIEEARKYGEEAVNKMNLMIDNKILHPKHPYLANAYYNLAIILKKQNRLDKALRLSEKASNIYLFQYGKDNLETAKTYNLLGEIYLLKKNIGNAKKFIEAALNIRESLIGSNELSVDLADSYHNMAVISKFEKNNDAANFYISRAIKIRSKILGNDSHELLASTILKESLPL